MKPYWKQLSLLLILFFVLILFFQGTSIYLFWSYYLQTGLESYFFGNGELGVKTMEGLAEVSIPHLVSQSLILFVLSHFLILYKEKTKFYDFVAIALMLTGGFNILANHLVVLTGVVYFKPVSFVLFQIFLSLSLFLIFKSFVFIHLKSLMTKPKLSLR